MAYIHIPKFFDTTQIYRDLVESCDHPVLKTRWAVNKQGFKDSDQICDLPEKHPVYGKLRSMFEPRAVDLCDVLDAAFDTEHKTLDPQFFTLIRYTGKIGLGPHEDVNSSGLSSFTTILIYINDDYEEGDLVLPDRTIKPEAGDVVAITSGQLHEALPPVGRKFIAVGHFGTGFSKTSTVAEDTLYRKI